MSLQCCHWCYIFLMLISFTTKAEEFVIVSNTQTLPSLNSGQVKMLYRGLLTHINGQKINLADLPANSEVRKIFYAQLLGKTPTQMQAIRARESFSGRSIPPYELSSQEIADIKRWLEQTPNSIIYVPKNWTQNKKFKILYAFGVGRAQ